MNRTLAALLGFSFLAAPTAAFSHATLELKEAPVGSTYKAVFRIGHGCDGEATLKVRVQVPEGFISVKPQPKAGWELETVKGKYAKAYTLYGHEVSEGVKEVVWTGSLLDEHYDEFVVRGSLAADLEPGKTFYIPVVQECATKAERWIQIPAEGQDPDDLEYPAPGVKLLEKKGGH
ncbi:YcnI family protein [Stappia sp. F7233]|uniref:YcnI family protein n=1 Tax=Stappia albiluteola TaxID=2758565 RepID=A0A839A9W7_9HYPH|nr:YcnI family protein [Stappia albiluteola]MBA5775905.1 YcnI family protein [Stappia albiluteola]